MVNPEIVSNETDGQFGQYLEMASRSNWMRRVTFYGDDREKSPHFQNGLSKFHFGLCTLTQYMAASALDRSRNTPVDYGNPLLRFNEAEWQNFKSAWGNYSIKEVLGKQDGNYWLSNLKSAYSYIFDYLVYEFREAETDVMYQGFPHGLVQKPQDQKGLTTGLWTIDKSYHLLEYIGDYIDSKYWYPNLIDPKYIWVAKKRLNTFHLPRISSWDAVNKLWLWKTGFGGNLVAPYHELFTSSEADNMWSDLIADKRVYETEISDAEMRNATQDLMIRRLPTEGWLIDLGGGKGDFIIRAGWQSGNKKAILIDNATKVVALARAEGIKAKKADLREGIPIEDNVADVVTMVFVVQWLPDSVLKDAHRILKPGGKLVLNVYPNDEATMERLSGKLVSFGYTINPIRLTQLRTQTTDHGLAGEEMELRVIEAYKK